MVFWLHNVAAMQHCLYSIVPALSVETGWGGGVSPEPSRGRGIASVNIGQPEVRSDLNANPVLDLRIGNCDFPCAKLPSLHTRIRRSDLGRRSVCITIY